MDIHDPEGHGFLEDAARKPADSISQEGEMPHEVRHSTAKYNHDPTLLRQVARMDTTVLSTAVTSNAHEREGAYTMEKVNGH